MQHARQLHPQVGEMFMAVDLHKKGFRCVDIQDKLMG